MIECVNASKKFGKKIAINHLSVSFKENGITGLIGPNGAGKTTFLHMLAGCLEPDEGQILVYEKNLFKEDPSFKQNICFLPDLAPLYGGFYPREFLSFIYKLRSKSSDFEKESSAIKKVTELFDLEDVLKKTIRNLSKGQKQRVALASCFVYLPKILLLDEPTEGLDPLQIKKFFDLINEVKKDHIIMISSHILSDLEKICDRFIFIKDGQIKICSLEEKNIHQLYFSLLEGKEVSKDVHF